MWFQILMTIHYAISLITSSTSSFENMWNSCPGVIVITSTLVELSFSSITCFRIVRTAFSASFSVIDYNSEHYNYETLRSFSFHVRVWIQIPQSITQKFFYMQAMIETNKQNMDVTTLRLRKEIPRFNIHFVTLTCYISPIQNTSSHFLPVMYLFYSHRSW